MSESIILVPLDGSKQALSALPVAKALGEIERAALHILHVGEHEVTAEELRSRLGREAPMLDEFTIDARVGMPAVHPRPSTTHKTAVAPALPVATRANSEAQQKALFRS